MVLIQDLVMFLDTERWVSKMGWEYILKGKGMSDRAKSLIDDVMSSEKLTTEEIREKRCNHWNFLTCLRPIYLQAQKWHVI